VPESALSSAPRPRTADNVRVGRAKKGARNGRGGSATRLREPHAGAAEPTLPSTRLQALFAVDDEAGAGGQQLPLSESQDRQVCQALRMLVEAHGSVPCATDDRKALVTQLGGLVGQLATLPPEADGREGGRAQSLDLEIH